MYNINTDLPGRLVSGTLRYLCVTAVSVLVLLNGCSSFNTISEAGFYQKELDNIRAESGCTGNLPGAGFFLFGMGNRPKMILSKGTLRNALTGDTIRSWDCESFKIIPPAYEVRMTCAGKEIRIYEDENGVWLSENGNRELFPGSGKHVNLPSFDEYKYGRILRVLHHEILINILESKPLPNFIVYKNPWRRDGAMMAMCLKKTGNIELIKDWVLALDDPYDRNNAGEKEPDNLGQTLYLLSLFTDSTNLLVGKILDEAKKIEVNGPGGPYLKGRSDFHETPVYQTKWLKFGLKALGLRDPYHIPEITDDYSALFWWDYKDSYLPGTEDACDRNNYPYLGWACDHFHGRMKSPLSNLNYPLTWETDASQADYNGMKIVDSAYVAARTAAPHTWHASEAFLYLIEQKK